MYLLYTFCSDMGGRVGLFISQLTVCKSLNPIATSTPFGGKKEQKVTFHVTLYVWVCVCNMLWVVFEHLTVIHSTSLHFFFALTQMAEQARMLNRLLFLVDSGNCMFDVHLNIYYFCFSVFASILSTSKTVLEYTHVS